MTDDAHLPSYGEWLILLSAWMLAQGYVLAHEHVEPAAFFTIPADDWHEQYEVPA